MGVDRAAPGVGPILRFQPDGDGAAHGPGVRVVVLDTTWTQGPDGAADDVVGLREIAARVLSDWDLIADTAQRLDAWAAASDVVEALTIEGTSFWFYSRLGHWLWLQQQLLWLAFVDDQVEAVGPSAIECLPGSDEGLIAAARLVGARDGTPVRVPDDPSGDTKGVAARNSEPPTPTTPTTAASRPGLGQRLMRRLRPIPVPSNERARRRAFIARRLETLASESGRVLVVLEHARQRIETPTGPRLMNAYLGSIVDRLRGTDLEPIEVDIRARLSDDADWERLTAPGSERLLPGDVIWNTVTDDDPEVLQALAGRVADRIAASGVALDVRGVDLGPALTGRVAAEARDTHAGHARSVSRLCSLVRRLGPSAILLADEYHRQEWLTAGPLEGVPTVAVQHGLIYRWHNGYMHRDRPDQLRLADRTYVFGDWERRLLTETSVYRAEEVRVSGSPRLDLVADRATAGDDSVDDAERDGVRAHLRAELGIATGDRLVVVSGTWGETYRRFHYPIALAALVDRPLPRVHLVVKLHPGEPDEGPYRAVIEGVAAARGFAPPPISIVQSIDLYRLLRAADAHVGVHSTVLTEAVATGTLNLLADTLAASDLLGYVDAGVAIPVRDGGDLLAALDAGPAVAAAPEARRAFIESHFRPGSASQRIADDLLAWPA